MTDGTVIQVNLDELQSVRDRERQTDKPQQLRESFYEDVGAFIQQLRAERDRVAERTGDPYAPEAMQLKDEIDAARQLVEDIHERRIGKVVKAASLDAADLSPEVDGLTAEEQELFDALVADIERHRAQVLDIVDEGTSGAPDSQQPLGEPADGHPREEPTGVTADELMASGNPAPDEIPPASDSTGSQGDESASVPPAGSPGSDRKGTDSDSPRDRPPAADEPDSSTTPIRNDGGREADPSRGDADPSRDETRGAGDGPDSGSGVRDRGSTESSHSGEPAGTVSRQDSAGGIERERILVTENLGTFVGSDDRDYDLAADDIVTLPSTNAELLVERDAARRL